MTNDYSTEADLVGDAMDAVYENKQVNKKDNISGDFSSDTESYPTVKAVKGELAGKVNTSDIENDLLATTSGKVLDARQGKALDDSKVDKRQATANQFVYTDNNKDVAIKEKIGNIDVNGKIGTDAGKIITTGNNGVLQASDNIGAGKVTDPNASTYTNIGTLASGATQQQINAAINAKIADILGINILEITTDKGTATADKMNKLWIETKNNKTDVFYVKRSGSSGSYTYAWEDLDTDILDSLTINWSDIQNRPTILMQTDIDNSISDFASQLAERINPSTP